MALNMQHTGENKWREKLKTALDYVSYTKWDGSTNITLERHISNFRQAYINLEGTAEHLDYQLPNEWTKVKNRVDSVDDCQNSKVCAAVSAIFNVGRGMSTDFERAAAFLLPTYHVVKKVVKGKMLLSLKLQGTRVVLAPVGSAYVDTQMKSMEPWIQNRYQNSTIGVSQMVGIRDKQMLTKVKREPIILMERASSRKEDKTTMFRTSINQKLWH